MSKGESGKTCWRTASLRMSGAEYLRMFVFVKGQKAWEGLAKALQVFVSSMCNTCFLYRPAMETWFISAWFDAFLMIR